MTQGALSKHSESSQSNQRALSKDSESTQRALKRHSKGTQRILKEHSESNQRKRSIKLRHTVGA